MTLTKAQAKTVIGKLILTKANCLLTIANEINEPEMVKAAIEYIEIASAKMIEASKCP